MISLMTSFQKLTTGVGCTEPSAKHCECAHPRAASPSKPGAHPWPRRCPGPSKLSGPARWVHPLSAHDRGNDAWKYKFIVSDSRSGSQDGSRVQSFGSREEEARIVEAFKEEEPFVSDTSDLEVWGLISHFFNCHCCVRGFYVGLQISKVW